jgi:general L-amino acid transport system permease protein
MSSGTPLTRGPNPEGAWTWTRKNLFSSPLNSLLTVLSVVFIFLVARGLLRWAIFTANWEPVTSYFKLYFTGQYPVEYLWRVGSIVWMVSFLMGLTWGRLDGTAAIFAKALAIALGLAGLLPVGPEKMGLELRLWFLVNPVLILAGFWLGRHVLKQARWVMIGWLVSLPLAALLIHGVGSSGVLPRVDSNLWGGLLLTFTLALVGIIASFPLGILLALGRRSSLPLVKLLCTTFIEVVRGVPLVTILFMASILLPLFLPEGVRVDRVVRAMIGMTLFSAAYMAENVRGGLAAIPSGQYEAAKAVGLNGFLTMSLIILPQALRLVIPAIVGQFIALFMDTTLAVIVGLLELLAVGKTIVQSNPEYIAHQAEVYLFVALVFWVFTFSMSYASRRLESSLGVGKR